LQAVVLLMFMPKLNLCNTPTAFILWYVCKHKHKHHFFNFLRYNLSPCQPADSNQGRLFSRRPCSIFSQPPC